MNKIFNLTSTFKALEDDDGSVTITGMASTKDFDRAGDTIVPEAWTKGGLSNFEKNPIILFNHDYNKPIGRATGLKVTENGLEMKAKASVTVSLQPAFSPKQGSSKTDPSSRVKRTHDLGSSMRRWLSHLAEVK